MSDNRKDLTMFQLVKPLLSDVCALAEKPKKSFFDNENIPVLSHDDLWKIALKQLEEKA